MTILSLPNTGSGCTVDRCFQFRKERTHHVLHRTEPRPRLRSSAHVIQNQSGVVLHDGLYEVGFPCQGGNVVDNGRAVLQSLFSDLYFVRVNGDRYVETAFQTL